MTLYLVSVLVDAANEEAAKNQSTIYSVVEHTRPAVTMPQRELLRRINYRERGEEEGLVLRLSVYELDTADQRVARNLHNKKLIEQRTIDHRVALSVTDEGRKALKG